jgi:tetratricopeptide (TPR) repeat protein
MKVFLSSTGRDLKAHRQAAFDAVQRLDEMKCVRMEDFRGPAVPIEDFDEQKVADCDLFVIILGHLHGTCPDGKEESYTELEYDAALRLKKPVFLFLAPEDFPLPANLYEDDAKRARQQALRGRAVGLIRNPFSSPDDLAAGIVQANHNWKPSTEPSVRPGSFLPLPPQPYFAHPYPLQQNFTGRVRERRMLTEWLTSGRNVLSLAAIGGMGKSALTWAWVQRDLLGLPLPGLVAGDSEECRVPEAGRPEGVLWWSFYEEKASFVAFASEAFRYATGGQAAPESAYELLSGLAAMLAQRRLLLVLDGFERELRAYASLNAAYQGDGASTEGALRACIDPRAGGFLRWIASAPVRGRVLLTTRLHPAELDGLAGCTQRDLNALNPEDAVHFFQAQGVKGTRAEIQQACAPYGYHPLALRLLAGLIAKDRRQPGDIRVAARHPVTAELRGKEKHHILQVAYDAMEKPKRDFLSRLAAFRSPVSYEALAALNPLPSEEELDQALGELIDRGLLLFDKGQARYDLHPVVRQHAYDRLTDKAGVHSRLRDYFAKVTVPDQDNVESVDALAPVIELYHHTLKAGQYDEARKLYHGRLRDALYHRFGAYHLEIELLRGLFPEGEDKLPCLKSGRTQAWTVTELANAYSHSGQSRRAIPLLLVQNAIDEKAGDKKNLAIGLHNVADDQLKLGQFRDADANLRREIELSREVSGEFQEAIGHQELGRLEAYQGRARESESELDTAGALLTKLRAKQAQGVGDAYRAWRTLRLDAPKEAIEAARKARQLAHDERVERDIIRAEWLLGWALIEQSPADTEQHLTEALTRCRRINNVDHEPDILLAWARWHRASGHSKEAGECVSDALAIADRCEYRLVQADAHNLLARLALDADERAEARRHAEIGKERAWCDGPPHCYKPALDAAEKLLSGHLTAPSGRGSV